MADELNVPPYILFSDATLKELSRYFPETKEDMLEIKGIGEKKYEQYGEAFLEVIQKWRIEHPEANTRVKISTSTSPSVSKPRENRRRRPKPFS